MPKSGSLAAAVFVGLALSGCGWSAYSTRRPAPVVLNAPATIRSAKSTASSAPPTRPDPQRMQAVMDELRQLGNADPAAQDQLLEQLRQSDPSLWPLVIEQFRATAAYRRRAMERVATTGRIERLPPPGNVAVATSESPQMLYPRTSEPLMDVPPAAIETPNQVVQASYTAIERPTGRLDAVKTPEAKPALAEAPAKPAESAPLVVRNMAFCTEVQSYGCVKRFETYEFQPNQEVLLYAEVENFASEPTPKGYHTSLKSSYQILDARGQRVAEHAFAATEEYCQNLRRDFFIGYHLRLPKGIAPGKHTLRLSIEDLKCRKVGQASVEFEVKRRNEG
jgi:hypothetical protein